MSDGANTTRGPDADSSEDVAARETSRSAGRLITLLLASIAVALGVVLVVVILNPPKEPPPDKDAVPSAQPDGEQAARPAAGQPVAPAGPPAVLQPAVELPSVAVPATAEELQREGKQVADALRQQYPALAQALHVAAMFDSQTRQTAEAEKLWQKCIELDPHEAAYYVNLAAIAMDRGNSQLAVDTLERAIQAGCDLPDVHHHLAVALTNLGRCDEAERVIQKALAVHPRSAGYWLVLGQAQLKAGKAAEAETSLKKAVELGTRTASVYFALGNASARLGKQEEAAEYRKRFAELKEETPLDKQRRYQILSTAEAQRAALTTLCEAAAVHRQQKNSLESERLLLRAVALDPRNPTPCRLLAELYEASGMLAEARVARQRLTEVDPFDMMNYLVLAQASLQLGESRSAEAALKLAMAIRPDAVEAYAALSQFHLQSGNAGKARWFAQEAIRRQPSAEGYQFLASACRAMGDEAAAQAALAEAGKLTAESGKPKAESGNVKPKAE